MVNHPSRINIAGLKLSLSLMLGLLVVPAYVVAPLLFKALSSVDAGAIAGQIFYVSNIAVLILATSAMLFCYRIKVSKGTWYLLIAVLLMVAANVFGVSTVMGMIKAEAGDISALAKDDAMRMMFAFWHGLGSILHLLASICVIFLVMKGLCPHIAPAEKSA